MFFTRLTATAADSCFKYLISDFYRGDVYVTSHNLSAARAGFLRDIKVMFDISMLADILQEVED